MKQRSNNISFWLSALILAVMVSPLAAFGQGAHSAPVRPNLLVVLFNMLPMFALVYFIFYMMVTRPQQQKLAAQQKLVSELKRSDGVITSSGIYGRVASVQEDFVLLEVANSVKIKVEKRHIEKRYKQKKAG